MRKASYVSRVLLSTFGTKLILLWLITLLISFGLSMSIGIARDQFVTQSYYLNDDMSDLAFFVDTTAAYYPDAHGRANAIRKLQDILTSWPGMQAVYAQTTLEDIDQGIVCYAYPSALLPRLHLPTAQHGIEVGVGGGERAVWLDNRLAGQYRPGDEICLDLDMGDGHTSRQTFMVAGFLNDENVHYDFDTGSSAETFSADFVVRNPSSYICVTVSDRVFSDSAFDGLRSSAKFLLPEDGDCIAAWKERARQQGVGTVSSMADILQNDRKNTSLMTTPVLILCIIMMVLALVGLIGTQMQLMNQYKQVAFSLVMSGMQWRTWKTAWLTIFCIPLFIASAIGASLGNAWESIVTLQAIRFVSPLTAAVSIVTVLLSVLGILPNISRWSRIDINEFRRLSE